MLPIIFLLMVSCQYSPWETNIDCGDHYLDNLERLAQLEANTAGQLAFSVALLSDFHNDLSDIKTAVERINQQSDVAFALVLGDMTDQGLAAEFEWMCKAMAELKVPRFYVIGNHDSISFGKEIFQEYFAPFDYAFSFKGVKFILYNDNAYEFPGAPDYVFLANEAVVQPSETRRLTIGASHVPPLLDMHTKEEADPLRQFLFDHMFNLTFHGPYHKFVYCLDEFGSPHHMTARVENGHNSMMFSDEDDQFSIQNCAATCPEAMLE